MMNYKCEYSCRRLCATFSFGLQVIVRGDHARGEKLIFQMAPRSEEDARTHAGFQVMIVARDLSVP